MRRFHVPVTPSGGKFLSIPFAALSLGAFAPAFSQASGAVGAPLILYSSTPDGPISGGENNKGTYLRVYGVGLGTFSSYGLVGTRHLTVGGVEVDNYRYLTPAVQNSAGTEGPGSLGIQALAAQLGALGSPALGTALAIDIVDNTGASLTRNTKSAGSTLDLDGLPIQFTPNNCPIYFVSPTGTDQSSFGVAPTGTQGTIANPLRHLQSFSSGPGLFGGALWGSTSGTITTANRLPPGAQVIARGGEYGADQTFNGSVVDFFRLTGLTSSASAGSTHITSYPGAAGANSPEVVTINTLAGSGGGFNFADTARGEELTPYGTTGWSQYIRITDILIHGPTTTFSTSGAAGCPVNWQTQALGSGVVNCDLSFAPTSGGPTSGGMGGYATLGRRLGNYVHDIQDPSSAQQNHGFYIGENTAENLPAEEGEIHSITAYNYMIRCQGGQGIMMRGGYQTETAPFCSIHHNFIRGPGKFGIEIFDNRDRANIWQNVIIGEVFTATGTTGTQAGIVVGSDNITATNGVYIGYNTVVGSFNHYAALYSLGGTNTGSVLIEGNIFRQAAGMGSPPFGSWLELNTGGITMTNHGNDWFDGTGNSSNPTDSTGIFVDPLLTSLTAPYDLHPSVSSTVANKGATPPTVSMPALDFFFNARPQGANSKWSLGAVERVGG